MYFLGEERFELFSGTYTHLLEFRALMPNDDSLLCITRHINDGTYADDIVVLFELFYIHLNTVGYFLFVVKQNLLTNDFAYKEAFGFVRQGIFIKVRWGQWDERN